jgi:hypothetical protein
MRQHTSAYVSSDVQHALALRVCLQDPAYVSIRQHTSAYVSIRQHTSACVSSDVQHTLALRVCLQEAPEREEHVIYRYNRQATSACDLNLLVHGALSYYCMRP